MNPIIHAAQRYSARSRARRGELFRSSFRFDADTRVLDLGSERGDHIRSVLGGTAVRPGNVSLADVTPAVETGAAVHGFNAVQIAEAGPLPFEDGYFDVVFCSSVIEHVTVPKKNVWTIRSGREFRASALARQEEFAGEIRRVGRQYFVQTPNRGFPIESHTWLPFASVLPRSLLLPLLRLTNKFWVKKTLPDWCLLDREQVSNLFPAAVIHCERSMGFIKSLVAVKTDGHQPGLDT